MNLSDLNTAISKLNPRTQKTRLKYLLWLRKKIEAQDLKDVETGNVPEIFKRQSGI